MNVEFGPTWSSRQPSLPASGGPIEVAPVRRVPVAAKVDPARAFASLCARNAHAFWLDGGATSTSYLGTGTRLNGRQTPDSLRGALRRARDGDPETGETGLGLVGWFDYEFLRNTLGMNATGIRGHESRFVLVETAMAVEPDGSAFLVGRNEPTSVQLAEVAGRLARLSRIATVQSPIHEPSPIEVRWRDSTEAYLHRIRTCQDMISRGEAYLLCLTTQAALGGAIDPVSTYLALRNGSATGQNAFIRIGGTTILSSSPERYLSVGNDGSISTSPIKGTRARSPDPVCDRELRDDLRASEKEQAENVMIVDLMRNDLSRICELGSIRVPRLFAVESYSHVHQLVSTIEGQLRSGVDAFDAVATTFPAGSMTGAPRRRAVELLHVIERAPRGAYSGAYGYFAVDGSAELSMTIRGIVSANGWARVGTGGGITALSNPEAEVAEMRLKAQALLDSVVLTSARVIA